MEQFFLNIQKKISKFCKFNTSTKIQWLVSILARFLGSIKFSFYHSINLINAKFKGVRHGRNFSTNGLLILDIFPGSTVSFGDNVTIVSDPKRASASVLYSKFKIKTFEPSSTVCIGNNVGFSGTSITCRSKRIEIGDNTAIGPNVIIIDSDCHIPVPYGKWLEYPGYEHDADVIIGKDCFIGLNSVILKGVHIGDHCVIAAGSVVVKDIPPHSIAAGVPAKVVKTFDASDRKISP